MSCTWQDLRRSGFRVFRACRLHDPAAQAAEMYRRAFRAGASHAALGVAVLVFFLAVAMDTRIGRLEMRWPAISPSALSRSLSLPKRTKP